MLSRVFLFCFLIGILSIISQNRELYAQSPGTGDFRFDIQTQYPRFYEHDNKKGRYIETNVNINHLNEYNLNDKISAIILPYGYIVTVYEHSISEGRRGKGSSRTYETCNKPSQKFNVKLQNFNDKITGIEVRHCR